MSIKLILNVPDIFSGGQTTKTEVLLKAKDFKGKTIKQVLIDKAFNETLKNQDPDTAAQALPAESDRNKKRHPASLLQRKLPL